jgi:hypothetical protein
VGQVSGDHGAAQRRGALLHDGLQITWPGVAPGQADNVVADGQTVAVSGTGTMLGIGDDRVHSER